MKQGIKLAILALAVVAAGCQTVHGRRETNQPPSAPPVSRPLPAAPSGTPAPVIVPESQSPQAMPLPPPKALPNYPKSADEISGGAVLSLLRQAQAARSAGRYDQAAAALERAQRIEPRNYFVWSSLAGTYLLQKNYDQAISVAQKASSLARGNVYVEQENWRVIRDARSASGDIDGAALAQSRIDAIQQLLQSAAPATP
ncbi:MAG: tetratricopeptide repeat protein [Nevskiaceae bacterium]|nr:MAG: tetratricopeptide repeat protein [Nevskiaceae bacterium]